MNRHTTRILDRGLIVLLISVVLIATGSAAVRAGDSSPEAPVLGPQCAAEPLEDVAIARVVNTNTARLSWTPIDPTTSYQVWRATAPYFDPALGGGNQIADVNGVAFGTDDEVFYIDNGVDYYPADGTVGPVTVIGNAAVNYYWVVRSHCGGTPSINSNRVGEFDFALTPGS